MGTWGPGILQDDVAVDVQLRFEDALAGGMSVEQASRHVLRDRGLNITDFDDGPVILLALAALQLQHQALDPRVQARALASIASGAPMARWDDESPDRRALHASILEHFEAVLRRGECDADVLQRMIDPDEGPIW